MNQQVEIELKNLLNSRYSTSESARGNYARGEDTYDPILSKAVVFPETNEEVSKILKLCNEHKIPVVPYGTGTSLEGNVVGNEDGITICLEKMNKILSVNAEDFDCRVQACVTKEQLNEYLREDGVFFPIDPGANAALGGMASTSASGTMAVKYGTMKTVISGLTVVLPNGDIINTGGRTKKTSAGYNLTNLFVGSEGTLGIITEVHLRLSPIPESIMSAVCHFPSLEDAVMTAQQVIQYGVPIARIEMLNADQMGISINYSKLKDIEAVPTLFFEFHGSESSNKENIKIAEKAIRDSNLGLNPQVDGQLLRIPLPDLSEERRQELSKIAAKYAENARIAVRNVRRDGMDTSKKMEKGGDISQDDRHIYDEEIQTITDNSINKIDELLSSKEVEIMQV